MLASEVIELVSEGTERNSMGDLVSGLTYKEIYANEKGIRQSEFYQAHAVGLKPELMYEISKFDYSGEKKIRLDKDDSKIYKVIRTYPTKNEKLEIVCEGLVNK